MDTFCCICNRTGNTAHDLTWSESRNGWVCDRCVTKEYEEWRRKVLDLFRQAHEEPEDAEGLAIAYEAGRTPEATVKLVLRDRAGENQPGIEGV